MKRAWLKRAPSAPWAITIGFALIILAKLPQVTLQGGRLWAEEGVIYFHNAWYRPWYLDWFAVHTGYVNFTAGFTTWAALHLAGLMYAPLVTLAVSLTIQCLPVYIITTHDFPWRRSLPLTIFAALMCALPPLTAEVWLNSITSQFHLALCAALIFAAPAKNPKIFFPDCAILALAGLSGPVACFLSPLLAVTACVKRDKTSLVQAGISFFGFAVQSLVFLSNDTSIRGGRLGLDGLLSVISLHTLVLPFAGITAANSFATFLNATQTANLALWQGALIFITFYTGLAAAIWRTRDITLAKLLAACIIISLISFYEALFGDFSSLTGLEFGERYAFIPIALNGLVIVGLASAANLPVRILASIALAIIFWVGVSDYSIDAPSFDSGPVWHQQVARWEAKPTRLLNVWPNKTWKTRFWADHKPRRLGLIDFD